MGSMNFLQWALLGPGSLQSSRSPTATHGSFQSSSLGFPLTDIKESGFPLTDIKVSTMVIILVTGELRPQAVKETEEQVSPVWSYQNFAPLPAFC